VNPRVSLSTVQEWRVVQWLATEDLDHFVTVTSPLRLEVLPLLGTLVDTHVFYREGPNDVGIARARSSRLPLDVAAVATLDVIVGRLLGILPLSMKLYEPLSREMNGELCVVDAYPSSAEAFCCLSSRARSHEAVEYQSTWRAGCRNDSLYKRSGLRRRVSEPFDRLRIDRGDIRPDRLQWHPVVIEKSLEAWLPAPFRIVDEPLLVHLPHRFQ
jgi:hypothetical protein